MESRLDGDVVLIDSLSFQSFAKVYSSLVGRRVSYSLSSWSDSDAELGISVSSILVCYQIVPSSVLEVRGRRGGL